MSEPFTRDQVITAMGRAIMLIDAESPIYGAEMDLANLIVNVSISSLDDPHVTLHKAIEENYETDPAEVLSWLE